jgi:hypothetical protein
VKYERVEIELKVTEGQITFYIILESPTHRVPSKSFNNFQKTLSQGDIFLFVPQDRLAIENPVASRIILMAQKETSTPTGNPHEKLQIQNQ